MGVVLAIGVALVLILFFGWWLSWTATRLDRLHVRVENARASLDAQLVRRASVTLELATSGLLDPASSALLAEAAHEAREVDNSGREVAETELTQALVAALVPESVTAVRDSRTGAELLGELATACSRVTLARQFLNDTVGSVQVLRATRAVRWFGLAGHASLPPRFAMDDSMPDLAS